ncbi:hypothetical protein ABW21_db0204331 [Orbilia brochopaga]|nr:hypothetical protein ABW21_db0204331 [Drechslerella brochopaga]
MRDQTSSSSKMDSQRPESMASPPPYPHTPDELPDVGHGHISPIPYRNDSEKVDPWMRGATPNRALLFEIPSPASHANGPDSTSPHPPEEQRLGSAAGAAPALQVRPRDLECLIAAARSSAFFAASRLRDGDGAVLLAHQITRRVSLFWGLEEEMWHLQDLVMSPDHEDNLTYQRSFQTCKDATEAVRRLLSEALERYEQDPEILWGLWCSQSVSFKRQSEDALGTLTAWENMFPNREGIYASRAEWGEATLKARQAVALENVKARELSWSELDRVSTPLKALSPRYIID